MRKALELDRRNCGLGREEAQTEKRDDKREQSHAPFLLFNSLVRCDRYSERVIRTWRAALSLEPAARDYGQ